MEPGRKPKWTKDDTRLYGVVRCDQGPGQYNHGIRRSRKRDGTKGASSQPKPAVD
jgi:hypothetical protein